MSDIEIAKLLNVKVDTKTGRVFLEMEVTDPTWKQKILREWQDVEVKLVIEEKLFSDELIKDCEDRLEKGFGKEDFKNMLKSMKNWFPKG